jgi:hypothetical protein
MLVAIQGFGSVWERRFGEDLLDQKRFARAAYYNTTGVSVNGRLHYRWRIGGKLRFNSAGGFNPNYPMRSLGRVFECAAPEQRDDWQQILFERAVRTPTRPEFYLFAITAERVGHIDTLSACWRGEGAQLVSFSEDGQRQEVLLLMLPYSWVRGQLGTFFVEPVPTRRWSAQLLLGHV